MDAQICRGCVLPGSFPGIRFSAEGLCQYCAGLEAPLDFPAIRADVESLIRDQLGQAPVYDMVLAFSGGKDSSFALRYLRETFPAARMIAFTVDNGFIAERARQNCLDVTARLGVDHVFFRPAPGAMGEIYRASLASDLHSLAALRRASAVCNSCIQVINTQILNFATGYDIPIVAGGYIGGQVPSRSGHMRQNLALTQSLREAFQARLRHALGDAARLFEQRGGVREALCVINPMVYLNLAEQAIIAAVAEVGWQAPEDTGPASTNCLLNDFAIHEHRKRHGFHPYVFEIALMVRQGTLGREEALQKLAAPLREQDFALTRARLGLG
jgi:tRNA(Ile)-lysidine synthase TilS/MesJ